MKLLLTKQIKKLNSELVVPKKGAAEYKSNKPIFDKETLVQLLNWTISDYNVTYNGYTMAVVEMSVTRSKNIIGQVTLTNGFHLFLAIDKIDEPTHIGLGGLETYDTGWGPLGLHCNTLSEDQQIVAALIPPNLNALVKYKLNPEQTELIKDICPETWLDRTNSIFCIKIQSLCNPNALHLFEKLGIDADTKIVYNHDNEIVKDGFSYYTFGDLLNCVSLWMRAALIRHGKFGTTPGPASDFEGDKLNNIENWSEKIPLSEDFLTPNKHYQYPHPLYKRDRTFGDQINPTFRGINRSMSSLDFIPDTYNRTYLLMLVPSTLVKEGNWYSAEFEPTIVCQHNEPVSFEQTNAIVKLILSYLSLSQSHNVVSVGDDPESDTNVKVVVEFSQLKSTGTNIKLRFTTRTPSAGAEDILVNQPENFAFKLEPHVGDLPGYFNQFSGMFLVDINRPTESPHSEKRLGDVYDKQQHRLWLNSNRLNGSFGSENMHQLQFERKTMSLWLEFCEQTKTDMVVNPSVDLKQTFLDMVSRSLDSSIFTSSEDAVLSEFFTKNHVVQLSHPELLSIHREAYKAGIKATVDRTLSPYENLLDPGEYLSPSYSLVKVKDSKVYSENAEVGLDEFKLEDGNYVMRKLDSDKVKKFKESLGKYKGVFRPKNQPTQVIEVVHGVIVSDSLNQLVGLKIDLESGTWTRHTDGGDWIRS